MACAAEVVDGAVVTKRRSSRVRTRVLVFFIMESTAAHLSCQNVRACSYLRGARASSAKLILPKKNLPLLGDGARLFSGKGKPSVDLAEPRGASLTFVAVNARCGLWAGQSFNMCDNKINFTSKRRTAD